MGDFGMDAGGYALDEGWMEGRFSAVFSMGLDERR